MRKVALGLLLIILTQSALAHVGYVATPEEMAADKGADWQFFFAPLHNPVYLMLILATILATAFVYVFVKHSRWCKTHIRHIEKHAHIYTHLTPWMLRISAGILLIGAGSAQVLLSPILPHQPQFAIIQILLGFLLMAGLFIGPVIFIAIVLYLIALSQSTYIFGNFEFLALLVALLIQSDPMPGLDHLLDINLFPPLQAFRKYVPLILRIGIGGAMTYLAIYEKFLNPKLTAVVIENYHLTSIVPVSAQMWVFGAAWIELAVGLALLFGFHTRLTAIIAIAVLSLSFFKFNEAVFSHVTLFGVLSVLFVYGGGECSIDNWWRKRKS